MILRVGHILLALVIGVAVLIAGAVWATLVADDTAAFWTLIGIAVACEIAVFTIGGLPWSRKRR